MSSQYPGANTATGLKALNNFTTSVGYTGADNSAYGAGALENLNTNKRESTAFGARALNDNSNGENSAFGAYAGAKNEGNQNTAVGSWALRFTNGGDSNTAVGHRSMAGTNTESGPGVGHDGDPDQNVAVGNNSLRSINSGSYNVAVGYDALRLNTNGNENVALGHNAGSTVTTGNGNVFVGAHTDTFATSEHVTLIGYDSRAEAVVSHATAVGAESRVAIDNAIVLGRETTYDGLNEPDVYDYVGIGTSEPKAHLHVNGGHVDKVRSVVDDNKIVSVNDYYVFMDANLNKTLKLTKDATSGQSFFIIAENSSGANTTLTLAVEDSVNHKIKPRVIAADGTSNNYVIDAGTRRILHILFNNNGFYVLDNFPE